RATPTTTMPMRDSQEPTIGPRKCSPRHFMNRLSAASSARSGHVSLIGRKCVGRCSKISASLACLVLVGAPVAAQEFEPRNEYEALTERPKSRPAIPPQLAEIIRDASPDRLLVNGLHGNMIEVDISWYEPR